MQTVKVKVNVSNQDIAGGVRKECAICPIALRLRRMGYEDVEVGNACASFNTRAGYVSAQLPREARDFVAAFDTHGASDVGPFSFFLDVPVEAQMARKKAA